MAKGAAATTATVFQANGSQAVQLPSTVAFPDSVTRFNRDQGMAELAVEDWLAAS